ncbi:MAG TPA: hypothetical protein VHF26_10155 [Trebonia sp.]|nr:hypothetical protein [Trebonia sp.]
MRDEQTEFAEFFHDSWAPCLRAVVASTGSAALAEDQVAEAFARAWLSWRKVRRHPAPPGVGGAHRAERRLVVVAPALPRAATDGSRRRGPAAGTTAWTTPC